MEHGETVTGVLASKRNDKKPRDLDIRIDYQLETEDPTRQTVGFAEYKM